MKKLFVLALAAISMVACVNEDITELPNGGEISFGNAFINNSTRAAEDPSYTTKSLEKFNVWGYVENTSGVVFAGTEVTNNNGVATYTGTQYWAPSKDYYFAAIAGVDVDKVEFSDEYKVKPTAIAFTNENGTQDLIYAYKEVTSLGAGQDNPAVALEFNHILSKVKFSFTNGFPTSNVTVAVEDITMTAVSEATYNIESEAWESHDGDVILVFGGNDGEVVTTNTESANERLIIPTDGEQEYDIEFTIVVKQGDVEVNRVTKTSTISGVAFDAGRAYNLTAEITPETLGMDEIEFTVVVNDWDTTIDEELGFTYVEAANLYNVYNAKGLMWIVENCGKKENFATSTIQLMDDIDLAEAKIMGNSFTPIGSTGTRDKSNRLICNAFEGTFDGNGYAIKNLYQSGWDMGYDWYNYGSLGLFAELKGATVKNVVIEGMEAQVEGGDISFIAGSATGDCVFENITIKDSVIGTYNNGCGGIIGWSGEGTYTFKNITLESDVVLGGLWGSFDSSIGGIVGQADENASYYFENCEINCRLDAYNDVTASYQWYSYRMCGMIIGRVPKSQQSDSGTYYPDPAANNVTCTNVVVNYGDWMNYHYCFPAAGGRASRVEAGYTYGGHDHNSGCTGTIECIPFDQIFGGLQSGQRVGYYGLAAYDGVTVNYPFTYNQTEVATLDEFNNAIEAGGNVKLAADINVGTTQLNLDKGQKIDLNGKTLTTGMTYGGIAMKNGASIKNGTIEHTSTVAAIKAFNVGSIENVTIKTTCTTANKTITAIAVQQGGYVGTIKDVVIEGISQGIEVGYQATVDLIENVSVEMKSNGTANGIGMVINGGKVGKAIDTSFKGDMYGITMHLKGVFAVGLELENCEVSGDSAAIYAWDEKGISNTSGSLTLTYDVATTLNGELIWDFEEECQGVVTLNRPN